MEHSFHYLLMASHAVFQRAVFSRLKDTGLTSGQPKVLDYLKDHNGASQKEIARGCHIEPASLTAVLNGMESKGLIERRNMNGNRRTSHVFMTEKGEALQQEVERVFLTMEDIAFSQISEEDRQAWIQTLEQIYDHLIHQKEELL